MMTPDAFNKLVAAIVAQGVPEELAGDYAAALGDTIEEDETGKWIIRDETGNIAAKIDPVL